MTFSDICNPIAVQSLASDAEKIWWKMIDVNEKRIRLPHDGYLKLWQLKRPQLDNYDVLMIDEAQDLTPGEMLLIRAVPNILFVFYSVRIVGQIVYSYSAE